MLHLGHHAQHGEDHPAHRPRAAARWRHVDREGDDGFVTMYTISAFLRCRVGCRPDLQGHQGRAGVRGQAAVGGTEGLRQDQPFLKGASNAMGRKIRPTQSNVANRTLSRHCCELGLSFSYEVPSIAEPRAPSKQGVEGRLARARRRYSRPRRQGKQDTARPIRCKSTCPREADPASRRSQANHCNSGHARNRDRNAAELLAEQHMPDLRRGK